MSQAMETVGSSTSSLVGGSSICHLQILHMFLSLTWGVLFVTRLWLGPKYLTFNNVRGIAALSISFLYYFLSFTFWLYVCFPVCVLFGARFQGISIPKTTFHGNINIYLDMLISLITGLTKRFLHKNMSMPPSMHESRAWVSCQNLLLFTD